MTPIPAPLLPDAVRLWRRHFGPWGPGRACPTHGIAAIDDMGRLAGVMGLRDAAGGFWRGRGPGLSGLLYQGGPVSADLVIDGIAAAVPRQGMGRLLVAAGLAEAQRRGYPGLRAEVRLRAVSSLAFYRAMGFEHVAEARIGWPWGGPVAVMRLSVSDGVAA